MSNFIYQLLEVAPSTYVVMRKMNKSSTPFYYSFRDKGQYWWQADSSFINDCFTKDKELASKIYNIMIGSSFSDGIDIKAATLNPKAKARKDLSNETDAFVDSFTVETEAFMKRATSKFKIPKFKLRFK